MRYARLSSILQGDTVDLTDSEPWSVQGIDITDGYADIDRRALLDSCKRLCGYIVITCNVQLVCSTFIALTDF
jgi:hypothetical protein